MSAALLKALETVTPQDFDSLQLEIQSTEQHLEYLIAVKSVIAKKLGLPSTNGTTPQGQKLARTKTLRTRIAKHLYEKIGNEDQEQATQADLMQRFGMSEREFEHITTCHLFTVTTNGVVLTEQGILHAGK
jgi:hypothetical protein